jgi:hypothetical protein
VLKKGQNWKDAGEPFDYTYDAKENCMLGGSLRRRLDRCLFLCRRDGDAGAGADDDDGYQVSLRKLGQSSIPNLTWNKKNPYNGTTRQVPVAPSDHFGIAVRFQSKG